MAVPAAPATMPSTGSAPSTVNGKKSVLSAFGLFANSNLERSHLYSAGWENLPKEVLCNRDIYDHFAYFLAHDHTDADGAPLKSAQKFEI